MKSASSRAATACMVLALWHMLSLGAFLGLGLRWGRSVDWVFYEVLALLAGLGAALVVASVRLRRGKGRVLAVTTLAIMAPMALGQLLFPVYVLGLRAQSNALTIAAWAVYWIQVALYIAACVAVSRARNPADGRAAP